MMKLIAPNSICAFRQWVGEIHLERKKILEVIFKWHHKCLLLPPFRHLRHFSSTRPFFYLFHLPNLSCFIYLTVVLLTIPLLSKNVTSFALQYVFVLIFLLLFRKRPKLPMPRWKSLPWSTTNFLFTTSPQIPASIIQTNESKFFIIS